MSDTPNPMTADEHLAAARQWLSEAEEAANARTELHTERERIASAPEEGDDVETLEARFYRTSTALDDQLEHAALLCNLHRQMAEVCGAYRDRQPRIEAAAPAPADMDAMAAAIGEQLAADTAAHEAVTLRPIGDNEPEGSEGDLWTPDGEWFFYAVNGHASPNTGDQYACRWLMVRHYAQVLRWSSEQGTKPMPKTWRELADLRTPGEEAVILRRPTAAERARFYGPEPDPQPAVMEQHERTTTIPANALDEPYPMIEAFTDRAGTSLGELTAQQLRNLQNEIARRIPQLEGRQGPYPRGGAAQWREG